MRDPLQRLEMQDSIALPDFGSGGARVGGIGSNPVRGHANTFVGTGLVLTDRDGDAAIGGPDQRIGDEPCDALDETLDVGCVARQYVHQCACSGAEYRRTTACMKYSPSWW